MIPVAPAKMTTFREAYQLGGVDFETLEYREACHAGAVEAMLSSFGEFWAQNMFTMAPYGAMLRIAEGIDALDNLARTETGATGVERASAIACGMAQLGGLLFLAVTLLACAVLCVCAPCGGTLAIVFYRRRRIQAAQKAAAQKAAQTLSRAKRFLDARDASFAGLASNFDDNDPSHNASSPADAQSERQPLFFKVE